MLHCRNLIQILCDYATNYSHWTLSRFRRQNLQWLQHSAKFRRTSEYFWSFDRKFLISGSPVCRIFNMTKELINCIGLHFFMWEIYGTWITRCGTKDAWLLATFCHIECSEQYASIWLTLRKIAPLQNLDPWFNFHNREKLHQTIWCVPLYYTK